MTGVVFAHDGEVGVCSMFSSITTAKGFGADVLTVPKGATHWIRFTSGAVSSYGAGETITGGTSAKTASVVGVTYDVGTTEGILFLCNKSGLFTATGETITGGITGTTSTIIQDLIALPCSGLKAKACLITVETASIKFTESGATPTITAGTNHGHQVDAGQSFVIRGWANVARFKCINAVASNSAIVKYSMMY